MGKLAIVDFSSISNPQLLSLTTINYAITNPGINIEYTLQGSSVGDLSLFGNYAFIAMRFGGVYAFDISNVAAPRALQSIWTVGPATDVHAFGNVVVVLHESATALYSQSPSVSPMMTLLSFGNTLAANAPIAPLHFRKTN